jgi:hypothetical protein
MQNKNIEIYFCSTWQNQQNYVWHKKKASEISLGGLTDSLGTLGPHSSTHAFDQQKKTNPRVHVLVAPFTNPCF